jgi:hypothetical protein
MRNTQTHTQRSVQMNLKNLYGTFLQNGNTPEAFIANVIYERYGAKRKKMLQGLYNIINGGSTHYWGKCNAEFIAFSMTEINVCPESQYVPAKNVNIHNLEFYA